MKAKFHDAFNGALNEIKADEQLKRGTLEFLRREAYENEKSPRGEASNNRKSPRSKASNNRKAPRRRLAVALASVAAACVACLFSYNIYFTEAAYVDIDVNPSIELTLNRFDRVIDAYAYNDDAKKVLGEVEIKHLPYSEAVEALVGKMAELDYAKDAGLFTATVQSDGGAGVQELADGLKAHISSALREGGLSMEEEVFVVDHATKLHAHEQNLTPAKYMAILDLSKVDPTATFDNCRDHTIAEIKQQEHDHASGGAAGGATSGEAEHGGSDGASGGGTGAESGGHHSE